MDSEKLNQTDGSMITTENGINLDHGLLTPADSFTGSLDSLFSADIIDDIESDEFTMPDLGDEREPSLQEALRCSPPPIEDWLNDTLPTPSELSASNSSKQNNFRHGLTGKPLYVEAVSGVSRQLEEAEHRGNAGAAVSLAAWRVPGQPDSEVRIAAGTLRGRVLAWRGATLRWATTDNADSTVTALAWRSDGARILACFACGTIVEYEATRGHIVRRQSVDASALWIGWAGLTAAVLLDASGSAWLLRCTKLLGSRSLKCSRLPGGEAGSALAAAPLDSKAVALAGTKRLLVLCGTHACTSSLRGPANCMPLLCWTDRNADKPVLVSARGHLIQMHSVCISKQNPSLTLLTYVQLSGAALTWLGDFDDKLIVLDSNENMYLYNDREQLEDFLDLSSVKIVYSSPFYKGVWSGEKSNVSKAVVAAGAGATGSALSITNGTLLVLGRSGVARVRRRSALTRAAAGCWDGALRTALSEGSTVASQLLRQALEAGALQDPQVAAAAVQLCIRYNFMDELWGEVWLCGGAQATAECLTTYHDRTTDVTPPPHLTQHLLTLMAKVRGPTEAGNFARSLAGTSPPSAAAALEWCQHWQQWNAAVEVCSASGSAGAPLRLLSRFVCPNECSRADCCPGSVLLKHTADTLASDKHADRYESLDALLRGICESANSEMMQPEENHDTHQSSSTIFILLNHNTLETLSVLHKALQAPPFLGPLGRHNRQRLLRALLDCCHYLQVKSTVGVLEFIDNKILGGILVSDTDIDKTMSELTSALLDNDTIEEQLRSRLRKITGQRTVEEREESPGEEPSREEETDAAKEEEEPFGRPLLAGTATRVQCMQAVARVAAHEAASRLAVSLHSAARALSCGALCSRCTLPLAGSRAHAAWCGHAWHARCDPGGPPPPVCVKCGRAWPLAVLSPNCRQMVGAQTVLVPSEFGLCITAPPRPDLEGSL